MPRSVHESPRKRAVVGVFALLLLAGRAQATPLEAEISTIGATCADISEEDCAVLIGAFSDDVPSGEPEPESESSEGFSSPLSGGPTYRNWEGKLELVLPGLAESEIDTSTGVAVVGESAGQLQTISLVAGGLSGTTILPITDPIVSNGGIVSVRATAAVRTGDVRIDPFGLLGGPIVTEGELPMPGELRLCIYAPGCGSALEIPLTRQTINGVVGMGVGGLLTVGGLGTIRLSVVGAPWTINTTSIHAQTVNGAVATLFSSGFIHGPLSFTSTGALTYNGNGGVMQMVTPIRVTSLPGVGSQNVIGGFARLTLHFVPEPSALLLFGTSAAALFLMGWARIRK